MTFVSLRAASEMDPRNVSLFTQFRFADNHNHTSRYYSGCRAAFGASDRSVHEFDTGGKIIHIDIALQMPLPHPAALHGHDGDATNRTGARQGR